MKLNLLGSTRFYMNNSLNGIFCTVLAVGSQTTVGMELTTIWMNITKIWVVKECFRRSYWIDFPNTPVPL